MRFRPRILVFIGLAAFGPATPSFAADCNRNGVADRCDVSCTGCVAPCGGSVDLNPTNGVPDECEGAPAGAVFTSLADFATGFSISADYDSVSGQLRRKALPVPLPYLWVAATNRGTVVKIQVDDGAGGVHDDEIIGEYWSSPGVVYGNSNRQPSRMAVDLDGSVWVANKEHEEGFAGSVVKIGIVVGGTEQTEFCNPDHAVTFGPPFTYNTCMDRNGDGLITTSNGLKPLDWPGEVDQFGGVTEAVDECIIGFWRLEGERIHHVSVDRSNNIWTGGHNQDNNAFELIDSATGEVVTEKSFDVACGGYHGVVDANDVLWSTGTMPHQGRVFRYETTEDIADCCNVDMLTDSDNDGKIDAIDDAAEEDAPGRYLFLNDDDDNDNGIVDSEESDVLNENDLVSIPISVNCALEDEATAWWSISWPTPEATSLDVWESPDKTGGPFAGADMPLQRFAQYAWPPPTTLWLEAKQETESYLLTFSAYSGGTGPVVSDLVALKNEKPMVLDLRVVMVVEPGANLDNPPAHTAGTKLTRTEVIALITDLQGYFDKLDFDSSEQTVRKVRLRWKASDPNAIIKLESACMWYPLDSEDFSICGNNPRTKSFIWYLLNVVDREHDTDAALACPLGPTQSPYPPGRACYDVSHNDCPSPDHFCYGHCDGECVINIYFVGNITDLGGGFAWGWANEPGFALPNYVLVSDGARFDGWGLAQPGFHLRYDTLPHEIGCHWLARMGHTPTAGDSSNGILPASSCPNNMCFKGEELDFCINGGVTEPTDPTVPIVHPMDKIPPAHQVQILVNNMFLCKEEGSDAQRCPWPEN